jgi:hypothetical protein
MFRPAFLADATAAAVAPSKAARAQAQAQAEVARDTRNASFDGARR